MTFPPKSCSPKKSSAFVFLNLTLRNKKVEETDIELEEVYFKNNNNGGYTLYLENTLQSSVINSSFENSQVAVKVEGDCPQLTNLTFDSCAFEVLPGACYLAP